MIDTSDMIGDLEMTIGVSGTTDNFDMTTDDSCATDDLDRIDDSCAMCGILESCNDVTDEGFVLLLTNP